jgi:hypothetical protein
MNTEMQPERLPDIGSAPVSARVDQQAKISEGGPPVHQTPPADKGKPANGARTFRNVVGGFFGGAIGLGLGVALGPVAALINVFYTLWQHSDNSSALGMAGGALLLSPVLGAVGGAYLGGKWLGGFKDKAREA